MNIRVLREGDEFPAIEGVNASAADVICPAMQRDAALFKREANRGVRLNIGKLRNHIFTHHRRDFRRPSACCLDSFTTFAESAYRSQLATAGI